MKKSLVVLLDVNPIVSLVISNSKIYHNNICVIVDIMSASWCNGYCQKMFQKYKFKWSLIRLNADVSFFETSYHSKVSYSLIQLYVYIYVRKHDQQ